MVVVRVGAQFANAGIFTYLTPEVTGLAPLSGYIGDSTTISGTKFGTVDASGRSTSVNRVMFGTTQLTTTDTWTNTSITIKVPAGITAGAYPIDVYAGGNSSLDAVTYTVLPKITSITSSTSPNYYIGNSMVTIDGNAFGGAQGSSTVKVGGYALANVTWTSTRITGLLSREVAAGPQNLVVSVEGQTSTESITCQPYITGVSTSFASAGDSVIINGYGFGSAATVTMGGQSASVTVPGNYATTVTVPRGAGTTSVPIVLTASSQLSNTFSTFTILPLLDSITPISGSTKTRVTLAGDAFTGFTGVTFEGASGYATVIGSPTNSLITVEAPLTVTGNVRVLNNSNYSNAMLFTYNMPRITNLVPITGNVSDAGIAISGVNFGTVEASSRSTSINNVKLGNVQLSTTETWNNGSITFTIPMSITTAGTYELSMTAGGNLTTEARFILTVTPEINNVTGSSGSGIFYIGNTSITIDGTAFGPTQFSGSNATIESTNITPTSWSATTIRGILPTTLSVGTREVRVVVSNSGTYTSSPVNVLLRPYITGLSTTEGPAPTTLRIYGYGFGNGTGSTVTIGGVPATVDNWGNNIVTVETPAGGTGAVVVTVQSGSLNVPSNSDRIFTEKAGGPAISSLDPSSGSNKTRIMIKGANLGNGTLSNVTFNGYVVSSGDPDIIYWSPTGTMVTIDAPAGGTSGPVIVNVGPNPTNSLPFTYVSPEITGIAPSIGYIGDAANISGTKFGTIDASVASKRSTSTNEVKLGGEQLPYGNVTNWVAGTIDITIPNNIATADAYLVSVRSGGNVTSDAGIKYSVKPKITNITGSTGSYFYIGYTSLTIEGNAFGHAKGTSTATVDGIALTSPSWAYNKISGILSREVTVGVKQAYVIVNGLSSNEAITCLPYITSLDPSSTTPNNWIIINGYGFTFIDGVRFNGVLQSGGNIHVSSSQSMEALVPSSATTGLITVEDGSFKSNGRNLSLGVPSITSCTPARYQGDTFTYVTVVGTNTAFAPGSIAHIAGTGVSVGTVEVTNSTHATVHINTIETSAVTGGRRIILITGLEYATGEGSFVINTPEVESLTPGYGNLGDVVLCIVSGEGTHFKGIGDVTTIEFSDLAVTGELINVTSPISAEIRVYVGALAVTGLKDVYMYTPLGAAVGTERAVGWNKFMVYGGAPVTPTISNVRFGGRRYLPGDLISATPIITAVVSCDAGDPIINTSYCSLEVDGSALPINFNWSTAGQPPLTYLLTIYPRSPIPAEPVNSHVIRIKVMTNLGGIGIWDGNIAVMSGAVQVVGDVLNYPNPFKPLSGKSTTIAYNLSINATVSIIIYDITGHEVHRATYHSGDDGGRAGINSVSWNGKDLFEDVVGNGMYVYKIVSGNKVIAIGKLVVLD